MRALGDGLSDIGRFSLSESNFRGSRLCRPRGLFEHSMINWSSLRRAEDNRRARKEKCADLERLLML